MKKEKRREKRGRMRKISPDMVILSEMVEKKSDMVIQEMDAYRKVWTIYDDFHPYKEFLSWDEREECSGYIKEMYSHLDSLEEFIYKNEDIIYKSPLSSYQCSLLNKHLMFISMNSHEISFTPRQLGEGNYEISEVNKRWLRIYSYFLSMLEKMKKEFPLVDNEDETRMKVEEFWSYANRSSFDEENNEK